MAWYLSAFAVLLVGVVAGGTLRERSAPAVGAPDVAGTQPAVAPAAGEFGAGVPEGARAGAAGPGSARPGPTTPVAGAPTYVFPVAGGVTYVRNHHDYPATDILAACGAPVLAVADGVVLEVNRTDRYDVRADDGATRGGLFVSVLGDDGVRYYGSHFRWIGAAFVAGKRVRAGDVLGTVGESGDASACHLHFGISPPCGARGDWWIRRGVIWPWSYLDSWRSGHSVSPAAEVSAWHAAHGCPRAP